MEECLLTCEGAKLCDKCQPENTMKCHGARYTIPFSLEFPHFEVIMENKFNLTCKKRETDVLRLVIVTHNVKPAKMKTKFIRNTCFFRVGEIVLKMYSSWLHKAKKRNEIPAREVFG